MRSYAAEKARLASLDPQIAALGRELAEEQAALTGEGKASAASLAEARARERATDVLARLKEEERAQLDSLEARKFVAEVEARRMRAEADRLTAETQAARASVGRLGTERAVRASERRANIARLELELARLEGERALLTRSGEVLEPLPEAEVEAKQVAALYGTTAAVGVTPTERWFRERAGRASLIHLATHGYFRPFLPMSSGVAT